MGEAGGRGETGEGAHRRDAREVVRGNAREGAGEAGVRNLAGDNLAERQAYAASTAKVTQPSSGGPGGRT